MEWKWVGVGVKKTKNSGRNDGEVMIIIQVINIATVNSSVKKKKNVRSRVECKLSSTSVI